MSVSARFIDSYRKFSIFMINVSTNVASGNERKGEKTLFWLDNVIIIKTVVWTVIMLYNYYTDCFVWVCNLVCHIKGRALIEGVCEQGLKRIFGSKRDEVTEEWCKLHNEEFRNLYSYLNLIRQVKSRRMMCAEHVARMCVKCTRFWWESPKERGHSEDRGLDGRMRSGWILEGFAGGGVD
jgi:hypothetical protein